MTSHPKISRKLVGFRPVTSIYNQITIAQPALTVLSINLDASSWPKWNTYNPTATIYFTPASPPPELESSPPELKALYTRPNYLAPGCNFTLTHSDNSPNSNFEIREISAISPEDPDAKGAKGYRVITRMVDNQPWFLRVVRILHVTEIDGGQGAKIESWCELAGGNAYLGKLFGMEKKIEKLIDESYVSLKSYAEGEIAKPAGKGEAEN